MKKKIVYLVIALSCLIVAPIAPAYADDDIVKNKTTCSGHFLGLPTWYDGLPGTKSGGSCVVSATDKMTTDELTEFIWTIVLNIAAMVIGIAGYLAIAMIIFGGFQYMLAQGNAAKAASAMKTIRNSLIGAVICSVASVISTTIRNIISAAGKRGAGSGFITSLFNSAMLWAGIICVVMVVIGGIFYTTSNGDSEKVKKAKNTITYAVIGLIITLASAAIVNTVLEGT